jgi:pyruvate/2-oxoglutarate dehydrogenase complex dihydrolipoamide acyltransferase (E2) component
VKIVVPDEILDTGDCVVQEWWFEDGELVEAGIIICDVMVSKATVEVPAPASGVLKILVQSEMEVGETGLIGEVLSSVA